MGAKTTGVRASGRSSEAFTKPSRATRRPGTYPWRSPTFWLALFQEAVSYDAKTHQDLQVSPEPVTLRLPWISPQIRLFRPNSSTDPVERVSGAREIKLEVPDEVMLVEIQTLKAAR